MQDGKLPRRQYMEEFEVEAIRFAESVGATKRQGGWGFRWRRWATGSAHEGLQALRCPKPCRALPRFLRVDP